MTKFNLSEKIIEEKKTVDWILNGYKIKVDDVKEFIKRLKIQLKYHFEAHKRYGEMTIETNMRFDDLNNDINKLAGDKFK